jgi:hypothetical protein
MGPNTTLENTWVHLIIYFRTPGFTYYYPSKDLGSPNTTHQNTWVHLILPFRTFSYIMGLDQHLRKRNGQSRESSNMGNTKHMTKHTPQYRKLRILAAQTQPKKKTML